MVNKQTWGSLTWLLFHATAYKLKPEHAYLAPLLFAHFREISSQLPCPDCAEHATQMWRSYPFKVTDKEGLVRVLFRGHNLVNRRLGKPELSRSQHDNVCESVVLFRLWNMYAKVMLRTDGTDLRLTDSFHRKRAINSLLDMLRKYTHCFVR